MIIVMKFGGSSLASAAHIRKVADLIAKSKLTPCVVLSAMGDTTNQLVAVAEMAERGEAATAAATVAQVFAEAAANASELLKDPGSAPARPEQLEREVDLLVRALDRAARQASNAARAAQTTDGQWAVARVYARAGARLSIDVVINLAPFGDEPTQRALVVRVGLHLRTQLAGNLFLLLIPGPGPRRQLLFQLL